MNRRASASKPAARRCAIYTRVSTDHGLEQDFNSLDAQREACAAYVKSQAQEGWGLIADRFDDGGYLRREPRAPCSPERCWRRSGSEGSMSSSSTKSTA